MYDIDGVATVPDTLSDWVIDRAAGEGDPLREISVVSVWLELGEACVFDVEIRRDRVPFVAVADRESLRRFVSESAVCDGCLVAVRDVDGRVNESEIVKVDDGERE